MRGKATALVMLASIAGCAYYNAMWSAEHFAKEARKLEARGQEVEARVQWARAAQKAESVVARHPRSRWADDALVLQAEGLARSGRCAAARAPISKAQTSVQEPALRERVGLAAAHCAVAGAEPLQAEAALAEALASDDRARRSRAEYLAGRAAALRLDFDAAVQHFSRSSEPAAMAARARALLSAGRVAEAAAVIDTLGRTKVLEAPRADLLVELAAVGGAEAASEALDRQIRFGRLPFGEQSRLLIADGDRLLARGKRDAAEARFRQVAAIAPLAAPEAGIASVRVQRVRIAGATQRGDLDPILAELNRLSRMEGAASPESKALLALLASAAGTGESPGERFRAAELVRDSLNAPTLAGQLFLDAAAADTASLYAPKALLGALALLPERRDSILAVIESRYPTSPYTRAYHGEPSAAYGAAEDSLARELGIEVATAPTATGSRFDAPVPGPRGPRLDEPLRPRAAAEAPPNRPAKPRPAAGERPTRDRPRERPLR